MRYRKRDTHLSLLITRRLTTYALYYGLVGLLIWYKFEKIVAGTFCIIPNISIEVWAQSIRGLPTTFFRSVPLKRGRRAVFGSKTITCRRSGSVGSRRRICPSQRSWERKNLDTKAGGFASAAGGGI